VVAGFCFKVACAERRGERPHRLKALGFHKHSLPRSERPPRRSGRAGVEPVKSPALAQAGLRRRVPSALPENGNLLERAVGIEPTPSNLDGCCSASELRPHLSSKASSRARVLLVTWAMAPWALKAACSIAHLDARSKPSSSIGIPHGLAACPVAGRHVHALRRRGVVDWRRGRTRYRCSDDRTCRKSPNESGDETISRCHRLHRDTPKCHRTSGARNGKPLHGAPPIPLKDSRKLSTECYETVTARRRFCDEHLLPKSNRTMPGQGGA
jgi:hypothetical protein